MKRELHKDRPPPLRIHKSHAQQQIPRFPLPAQYRQPVIIHTYSPKIIQTDSNNFMQLVQRLTGQGDHIPPPPKRSRLSAPSDLGNQATPASLQPENQRPPQARSIIPNPPSRFQHSGSVQSEQWPLQIQQRNRPGFLGLSPGDVLARQALHGNSVLNIPSTNSLLSPSIFDFSPSLLPSPSAFSFDFPSLSPGGILLSPAVTGSSTPRMSVPAAFPSPGPLTSAFLSDLPVLSPAAYKWIEKNYSSAEAILSSQPLTSNGLPPRPPEHGILLSTTESASRSNDRSAFDHGQ